MKKLTLFLLAALCLTAQAFGQAARFDGVAQSTRSVNGITLTIPLPSATITVYNFGTTTKASVCPDITATSCSATVPNNPVTSDAQGNFGFWVPGGVYDYTVCPSSGVCQGPYHAVVPFGVNSSGSVTYSRSFENIRFADQFVTTAAAFTDAGTTGGVMFPPNYTIGTFTNSNSRPVIDFTRFDWRGFFLARDSGAVGDTSTDDTTALQSWINSVATAQGEGLLPCGTFKITSQLNVAGTGRFTLRGTGDCSIIQFDGSTVPIALGSPDATQRILIRIDGIKFLSSTTGSGLAIDASHWAQSSIEHVNAFGVNKCILFGNVHALYDEVRKLRCSVTGAGSYGVKFDSVANENSIYKARIITDANSTGVIVNTQGIKLYDVDVETGALVGIDVQASARTTLISGAWLEGNQTNLQLASGAQGTTVIASEIDSGSVADITDNGATGTSMCGVRKTFIMQPCTLGSGLITSNSNPASAGTIRMAVGDSIKFRNNANSADITAAALNASDQMTVGGTAGIIAGPVISNSSANVAVNGIIRMVKTDTIKFRNNAASADVTAVALDASDVVQLGGTAGVKVGASGSAIADTRALIQSANNCGTTTTCANTANNSYRLIVGNVALSSASPSTATITGISPAFTSTATYNCTATPEGATAAIAAGGIAITKVSGSSFTLTGPNTVTTVIDYTCVGN